MVQSLVRMGFGVSLMAMFTSVWTIAVALLLPFRSLRIKACNVFGKIVGPTMMKVSGCPVLFDGREQLDGRRPAIYVSNHTSIYDIFLGIWMAPIGTVGIAKKEVIYYPFFGQLYWLSGHLRIDRSRREQAVASMREIARVVKEKRLSIWMWPEGTRSRSGRLLPFKKGIVHLAMQTGLPVVPVVVTGAQDGWEKSTMRLKQVPIRVSILPAIDTSSWALETIEEHVEQLYSTFVHALPPAQQPSLLPGPVASGAQV